MIPPRLAPLRRHRVSCAGWLTECTCLDLSNNELGPAIPGSYGGLLKCKRIWLNDNLILEPVPSTMVGTTSIVHRP